MRMYPSCRVFGCLRTRLAPRFGTSVPSCGRRCRLFFFCVCLFCFFKRRLGLNVPSEGLENRRLRIFGISSRLGSNKLFFPVSWLGALTQTGLSIGFFPSFISLLLSCSSLSPPLVLLSFQSHPRDNYGWSFHRLLKPFLISLP